MPRRVRCGRGSADSEHQRSVPTTERAPVIAELTANGKGRETCRNVSRAKTRIESACKAIKAYSVHFQPAGPSTAEPGFSESVVTRPSCQRKAGSANPSEDPATPEISRRERPKPAAEPDQMELGGRSLPGRAVGFSAGEKRLRKSLTVDFTQSQADSGTRFPCRPAFFPRPDRIPPWETNFFRPDISALESAQSLYLSGSAGARSARGLRGRPRD